ncbi:MAG: SURF1 family protein [Brevirhabdus sp.]
MKTRLVLVLLFGLVGTSVLLALGTWQVRRLAWKEAILAEIETRIADAPVSVPAKPDPDKDRFLPVTASGTITQEELVVLASRKRIGAGYRVITVLVTDDGRRLLLDRGFLRLADAENPRPAVPGAEIEGNLHWPDEIDSFTPEPDAATGMWFARDVALMSEALETEPVMIIARSITPADPVIDPMPVTTEGIPNDHLGYAITWFSLAVIWVVMTAVLMWRLWRRTD